MLKAGEVGWKDLPLHEWRRLRRTGLEGKSRPRLGAYAKKYFGPSTGDAGGAVGHEEGERVKVKIEI